jgi:hypothetical protein
MQAGLAAVTIAASGKTGASASPRLNASDQRALSDVTKGISTDPQIQKWLVQQTTSLERGGAFDFDALDDADACEMGDRLLERLKYLAPATKAKLVSLGAQRARGDGAYLASSIAAAEAPPSAPSGADPAAAPTDNP